MTTYNRQGTAPIADGDALSAAEVEAEFESIRAVINGNIDNANIVTGANILGSKLAAGTITESKITASTLTTASLATSATMKAYISAVDGASTTVGTSTSWADVPVIVSATLTPGSASDMIMMDCTLTLELSASDFNYDLGFSVDGTDVTRPVARILNDPDTTSQETSVHFSWMQQASGTTAVIIKPRIKAVTGSGTLAAVLANGYDQVFRAFIIPIK